MAILPPQPLPAPDRDLLARFFSLGEDLHALAARTGRDYIDLLAWFASPPIQALLRAHRTALRCAADHRRRAATQPAPSQPAGTSASRAMPLEPSGPQRGHAHRPLNAGGARHDPPFYPACLSSPAPTPESMGALAPAPLFVSSTNSPALALIRNAGAAPASPGRAAASANTS